MSVWHSRQAEAGSVVAVGGTAVGEDGTSVATDNVGMTGAVTVASAISSDDEMVVPASLAQAAAKIAVRTTIPIRRKERNVDGLKVVISGT